MGRNLGVCALPFGLSVVQLQKVPLHFALGRVVGGQSDVGRDEVEVDGSRLQPDRATKQRGLALPGRLQSRRLAVQLLLLLDVLTNVDVVHHSADAFSHCLVVKVAVGHANYRSLWEGSTREDCTCGKVNHCRFRIESNKLVAIN